VAPDVKFTRIAELGSPLTLTLNQLYAVVPPDDVKQRLTMRPE
jgi:hypothetical protein